MTVTAAGSLSLALAGVRTLLLASDAFVDRITDAWPGATPADSIYYDTVTAIEGLHERRPYALVKYAERGSHVIAEGVAVDLIVSGGILLLLEDNANYRDDHNDSYLDYCNWIGSVMDEIEILSGSDDYLPFRSDLIFSPQRTERGKRQEDHDYWTAAFVLEYGDQL